MTTFHLYQRPCGRVVLNKSTEPKSTLIRTIKAADWKAARATIKEDEFFHDIGHGYFIEPRPGAYQRQSEYHDRQTKAQMRRLMLIAGLNDIAIRPKKGKRETLEV